jgi:hypothetical protein
VQLELIYVRSSTVAAVGYDPVHRWLDVVFMDGLRYRYLDVPIYIHGGLMSAVSKGTYFNRQVKGRFSHAVIGSPNAPARRPDRR